MPRDRRFSDDEVGLILRKAADLQVQGAAPAEGLSLEAIQDIAREVGIRPEVVAEAAALVQHGTAGVKPSPSSFDKYRLEMFTPGAATDEQISEVPSVIRKVMETHGQVSEVVGAVEWSTVGEPSAVAVVIRRNENGSRIEVTADRSGAWVLTFLPTTLGGFLLGAISGAIIEPGVAGGIAVFGVGIASGVSVGWAIWTRNTARFKKKMQRLAESLRDTLWREDEGS